MRENTTEPKNITQGDSVSWSITNADYPASEGWVLSYALVTAGYIIQIDSTQDGDKHSVNLTTATTAAYSPGVYTWTATVSKTPDRRTIAQGSIEILADLSQLTDGADMRSHAKRTLDDLEAAIERHAATGVISSSVAGRTTVWRTYEELLALRDRYLAEYHKEQVQAGVRNPTNRILVRF